MTRVFAAGLLALLAAAPAAAAPPAWLQAAAKSSGATGFRGAALVLLDDVRVTVTADGRQRTTRRYAVRLNDREARAAAAVTEVYITGSGKVKEMRGWLLRASGDTRDLGNDRILDLSLVDNDVYNEARLRVLDASAEVGAGDVFGAEIESEDRVLFAQIEWPLQVRWPVQLARRTLTLPAGWRARSVTFNAPAIEPRSEAADLVWELRDLAGIPAEDAMPPASDLAPRLAVSFFGAGDQRAPGQFENWTDVAAWLNALSDSGAQVPEAVGRKARELTASAATEFDRIAAIARFVQHVQYVSIQTGLGRGGGYQPRPPALVLERNYGDCKDKANLMRAMLAAAGINSHLVSVFSGDRKYVRPEWPSPQQFNHAIIAIAVAAAPPAATVIDDKALGRLLLFDPTDEHTPVGQLPLHEQGSYALIVHGSQGSLVRVPSTPESQHKVVRTVDGAVGAGGELSATVVERASGDRASQRRAMAKALDPAEFRELAERRVAAAVQGGRVGKVEIDPSATTSTDFVITMQLSADRYAQQMGTLLLVRAPFDLGDRIAAPSGASRTAPIDLQPLVIDETVRLGLPSGFAVDELPPSSNLDTAFGRYSISFAVEGATLVARRTLAVRQMTVPAADYGSLRSFFDRIRTADTTPAVLARK